MFAKHLALDVQRNASHNHRPAVTYQAPYMLRGGKFSLLFNGFDPRPSRLTLPHQVGRNLQVLRSTQSLRDHGFGLLPDELSKRTDQEAGKEVHGPRFGDDAQDVTNVVPSSESVEELARPFNPVADIFDPEELKE